jgi:hypothetical protein
MLGRLHHCLWVACLVLGVGTAHGQTLPPGAYGPYYGPAQSPDDYVDPNIVTELLPPDRGLWWDVDLRLNQAVQGTMHNMWFRLEWLSTEIDAPGNTLLGANMSTVPDPRQPFDVQLPNGVVTTAVVLDTSSVNFDNINGLRGTWGVPLSFGHIETAVWGTENSTSRINTDVIPSIDPLAPAQVVATSLLTNGAQGTTVLLYDLDFQAKYSTELFSAESNLYYNYQAPRMGLRILPLAGFRFVDYDEALVQKGSYDNSSGLNFNPPGILIDPIDRRIESVVDNDVYGLQTGLRTEFVHNFFTLGIEPKVALGVNHYEARVSTNNLRDSPYPPIVDDGLTESKETQNIVAPYFDWSMYAKVHLSQSFHLRAGWNFTWFSNISRADDNIYYNDNGIANPPAVRARAEEESLSVSTFSFGGDWILP